MSQKLISICIPTYNRPLELKRTLESIDTTKYEDVDIVISENCSPKQAETREVVEDFKGKTKFEVHYYENERNLGYDKNIRALVAKATGRFCMFFSDDDMFMPKAMDDFVEFVRQHKDCGYILRSYRNYRTDGSYQDFRYYSKDREFPAGKDTAIELFDKSVFLSGFTIRSDEAKKYVIEDLDGSLLYQLYLLLEVCRRLPSAYSRILISKAVPISGGVHYFGDCEEEKEFYEGKRMDGNNAINFDRWYIKVVDYISNKYNDDTAKVIKHNMSKYSYVDLALERRRGVSIKEFTHYAKELKRMGLGSSIYFYIYYFALVLFGYKACDKVISIIKNKLGHRPHL